MSVQLADGTRVSARGAQMHAIGQHAWRSRAESWNTYICYKWRCRLTINQWLRLGRARGPEPTTHLRQPSLKKQTHITTTPKSCTTLSTVVATLNPVSLSACHSSRLSCACSSLSCEVCRASPCLPDALPGSRLAVLSTGRQYMERAPCG